jgi:hypothetical protein
VLGFRSVNNGAEERYDRLKRLGLALQAVMDASMNPVKLPSVPPVKLGTIGTMDWLAAEIGCSNRQARRYCKQRMVPGAYQVDKRGPWRIRKAEARAWIDKIKTKLRA